MKTIVYKKPRIKYIEIETDEFDEVVSYKTDDGKEFSNAADAFKHDAELRFKKVEQLYYWFPLVGNTWYKADDDAELQFLIDYLSTNYGGHRYGERRLRPGEWFTVFSTDTDGQGKADHFLPLSKLKTDYKNLLKTLEKNDRNLPSFFKSIRKKWKKKY